MNFLRASTRFGATRVASAYSRPTTLGAVNQVRYLNLHEYQSKDLMEAHGVSVQWGKMADNPLDAKKLAQEILARDADAEVIVKAQIHAGGRGKGHFTNGYKGGVKIIKDDIEQVSDAAKNMLGNYLVTKQTGPEGQLCTKVLINHGIDIKKEFYFAILMDRAYNGPVMVASRFGGMNIEEVAEENPEAIFTEPVCIMEGVQEEQTRRLAQQLGFEGDLLEEAAEQMARLYRLFISTDATQVEINPLAITTDEKVYAVDAKLNFDDNAAFRHQHIFDQRDKSMEDARDVRADEAGLNYIGLDGNIGCMVNGAGLAMATMDIVQMYGGSPANFLDVGGGAQAKQVAEAFKILTSDANVKALLVNIFGGIMKCDVIAEGIVAAHREVGLEVPLVVRLEGTNVEAGKQLLRDSGLPIITADDLDDAAQKAVAASEKTA